MRQDSIDEYDEYQPTVYTNKRAGSMRLKFFGGNGRKFSKPPYSGEVEPTAWK